MLETIIAVLIGKAPPAVHAPAPRPAPNQTTVDRNGYPVRR